MIDLSHPIYPVRVVLRRTGLSAELLRAWERRYGVVAPSRTEGGQRLYSESDVTRLSLLRRATLHGHAISRVAELTNQEIEELIDEATAPGVPGEVGGADAIAGTARAAAMQAIQWMDGATLDSGLRRAAMVLGPVSFAEQVVAPLVREIGDLWHAGRLRIVQEHLASTTIRQVLSGILAFTPANPDAPLFVSATTSGQRHELGAMLAATVAAAQGWRSLYLGPDLPGAEIGLAAARLRAAAIGLSFVYPAASADNAQDLAELAEAVGRNTPVYLGGAAAGAQQSAGEHGFIIIESLKDLGTRLAAAGG
ncbi:MAG: MerR family transcriptional regulator [Gemmatimonadales bacterium]